MQFAEMDIIWENTFIEVELKELNFDMQHLKFEKNTTREKINNPNRLIPL